MKSLSAVAVAVVVIAVAVVGAQSKTDQGSPGTVDAGFRALSEQFTKAAVAGDAKAIAALYADDGVEMRPDMPPLKGRAAIQQFYEKMIASATINKLTTSHSEMRAFGDTGYDVGTFTQTYTPTNAKPMNTTGKYVAIVKRVGGAWKIAYMSLSLDSPAPKP
jgi:uncharacterized protein (TIGR02246 family)